MKAIEMSDVLNAASKNIIIQNSWKQAKKLLIPTLAKIKNTLKNISAFNYIANLKKKKSPDVFCSLEKGNQSQTVLVSVGAFTPVLSKPVEFGMRGCNHRQRQAFDMVSHAGLIKKLHDNNVRISVIKCTI